LMGTDFPNIFRITVRTTHHRQSPSPILVMFLFIPNETPCYPVFYKKLLPKRLLTV